MRYVHDAGSGHRFVPAPPAEVLANRYGDCKDRAFLVQAVARRAGLEVELALVSTRPHVVFPGATCLFMYDHVINAVAEEDGGWLLFDPTGRHVPFGELPGGLVGHEALVVDPDHPAQFTIPPPSEAPDLALAITAHADTLDAGHAAITLRGHFYQAADAILAQVRDGLKQQNALDRLIGGGLYKIRLDHYELTAQGPDHLALTARADLSDFVVATPARLYVPRVPFAAVSRRVLERADDALPLHLPESQARRLDLTLVAPGATAAPETTSLGDASAAHFTASLAPGADGRHHLAYALASPARVLAGDARARYLEFCRAYLAGKRNLFTLDHGSP